MQISVRGWFVVGACAVMLAVLLAMAVPLLHAADSPPAATAAAGRMTAEQLGQALQSLGLQVKQEQQRFDFTFRASYEGQDWDLTMSAVLSQNGESVWLMAWLDELPAASADVPKIALLRLLANNDRLGKGQFFAFVAANRRFVLQRVLDNQNLSAPVLRATLQELGGNVAQTYPFWATANWKADAAAETNTAAPANPNPPAQAAPPQNALRDSKFTGTVRQ